MEAAPCYRPFVSFSSKPTFISTKLMFVSLHNSMQFRRFKTQKQFLVLASENNHKGTPISDDKAEELLKGKDGSAREIDLGWLPAFPHVLTASMANFLFGYHIGVMNGPIVSVARELGFEGNSIIEGLVVSIFIGGAFIGSLFSGSLADKFGCRRTLQIDTIPLIIGAILSAQAHSTDEVLWGRFLVGLGIGVNTVLVPIYISEVAPTKYRGSLGSLCQIGTCLGIIASLFIATAAENDPHWWRTMLYIASIPGFILTIGMQFAADSPRWLCKMGRLDDAKSIIRNLWGPSEVDSAIEEFQSVFSRNEGDNSTNWLELFEEPNYKGALSALFLIDKQGRRKLLIGSYLGMGVSMFLIAYGISFPDEDVSHNLSILGTLGYIYSFAIGAGPVTGIIIPELSSSRMRGKIMSFSFSVHWVCNFLVGLFFLELVRMFGVAPIYMSFGGVSLLSAIFCYSFIIETQGRSLEEIEMSLRSKLPGRDN
ncbi:probable plastidic glucose transporter 1 isoform X3 [Beta vulgaris subsp. vulgaris]|uniref:probable plastidic glucose transporter 1 isoform X3 n=1 Tax=Beta vulgaris subsp. vulgaris TaxID=3555 RepID=UPI002037487D|nr:probable plastidic glucose transporter 1 isoform X3 [Beta vulgaris subsp. vulgaris]